MSLYAQFRILARQHAAHAKVAQTTGREMMSEAAKAASCHDTYKAYQLINRLAPIRDEGGMPLGPLWSLIYCPHTIRS